MIHHTPQVVAIIPARYASTRFPGKPLIDLGGKSMIQRVYEQAQKSTLLQSVIVATDDARIASAVQAFGGDVHLTDPALASGTDRCAAVAESIDATHFINIQGDEPFIQPAQIDEVVAGLLKSGAPVVTQLKKITDTDTLFNPNVVKAVINEQGQALYFSRHPIPYCRGAATPADWLHQHTYYKHIGIYAFTKAALLSVTQLPPHALEQTESLEQLRWLAHGMPIHTVLTEYENIGIDTPADVARVQHLW